jgi:hypothetical protein
MKTQLSAILIFLISYCSYAQIEHFDTLLKENISNEGVVNYKEIIKNKHHLDHYISYLEKTNPAKDWSADKIKAFWMNAYNAYTIKTIIDNYPIASITKINSEGKDAWHQPIAKVGGKSYTLNEIEHEQLRAIYKDPRIHVGVNCASFSCPPIANFAFTEANTEIELERLMKQFVNDPKRNTLTEKKVTLSKIFEWYKSDFTTNGKLIDYIISYSNIEISKKAKVRFLEYNWSLNE